MKTFLSPTSPRRLRLPGPARLALAALLPAVAALVPGSARAGSFQINEQSVSGLGVAYAGQAAAALDASTVFANPAGMALVPYAEVQGAANGIIPRATFSNRGSNQGGLLPLAGNNGGDGGTDKVVPNGYLLVPLFHDQPFGDLAVGLALTAPYGLETDYDPGFVGRYFSLRTKLTTIDIAPSFGYRFLKRFSVGAGLDIQYATARLSQAVDFGTIGFGLRVPGYLPQRNDGITELHGTDWSVGYNVGGIFEYLRQNEHAGFLDDGRVGFHFRSGINHVLKGESRFSGVPVFLGRVFNTQADSAALQLPETYSFSLYQGFLRRFALLGDVTWTRWSQLQSIVVSYSNPLTPPTVLGLNYKNAFRYAVGLTYQPIDALVLRVGYAYDDTPIQSALTRTPRIPDSRRNFVSTGFKYSFLRNFDLDVAYAHLFVQDPQVNVTDSLGHNLRGKYSAAIDVVSAGLTFRFGPQPAAASPASKEGKETQATYRK